MPWWVHGNATRQLAEPTGNDGLDESDRIAPACAVAQISLAIDVAVQMSRHIGRRCLMTWIIEIDPLSDSKQSILAAGHVCHAIGIR